jgi:CTP synthase (UTP-ammonia lyase)
LSPLPCKIGGGKTANTCSNALVALLLPSCTWHVLFELPEYADPYLNTDAGTMSPFEHGEVFVLDDGGEVLIF